MDDDSMSQQGDGDAYDPTQVANYDNNDLIEEDDDEDDYDPSNVQFQDTGAPTNGQSNASTPQPSVIASKQRTVGGFIEDDDDEEDTPSISMTGQDNATALSGIGRSVSQTPINNATSLHASTDTVSIDKAATPVAAHAADSSAATLPSINIESASATASNGLGVTPSQTPVPASISNAPSSTVPLPKARLPQDTVGILEDRIAADPRGDTDAWMSLIEEYKQRNKIEEVYETYERFLQVFPQAGDQWAAYISVMMQNEDTDRAAKLFGRALMQVPHVRFWSLYVDYIRRKNNVTTDTSGGARQVINAAFKLTFEQIGQDPVSLSIWQDFINYLKAMPGNVSGDGWQDKQKVDLMRKAYREALSIPLPNLVQLWGEYTNFELSASRVNGRKFQSEQMPAYMTAKQAFIALENKIQHLNRTTLPRFPPLPGFDGFEDYQNQVRIWREWIEWEKEDPLVLKDETDGKKLKNRVLFVYKLALMTLRYDSNMWFEAVQYCFDNDLVSEGDALLTQAIEANPESCLLAFCKADRIETQTVSESDPASRGTMVRQPYNKLIDTLYGLIKQTKDRQEREIAQLEERYSNEQENDQQEREKSSGSDDEGLDEVSARTKQVTERKQAESKIIEQNYASQLHELKRLLTSAWVALIRAMRRIQGKGKPNSEVPGSRGVLSETRKRGNITSDLYLQCALIEWHCYKDQAALRLFDKGMQLYPTDENFALEYIKHLISLSDLTNARTVFEKAVSRLEKEPASIHKAKPLYSYFHTYESKYGELPQIQKLEQRMRDLFPEDPTLSIFAHRYEYENALGKKFDPTKFQPIISPNTQTRSAAVTSVEQDMQPAYLSASGALQPLGVGTSSPKRPLDADGTSDGPPRKFQRGESPLKGAAGRRLANNRQPGNGTPLLANAMIHNTAGWPIPQHINFLLSVLPNSRFATSLTPALDSVGLVNVMRGVNLQPKNWATANLKTAGPGLMAAQYHQAAPTPQPGGPLPPALARPGPSVPLPGGPPQMQMQHGGPPQTPTYHAPPSHAAVYPPQGMPGQPPMSQQPPFYPPPNTTQYGYTPQVNAPYPPQYR